MHALLPRLIRFKDAPTYLGMDRNRFNSEVRPFVTEIPIGSQGIAFDRLDLDEWVENCKAGNRHAVIRSSDNALQNINELQGCSNPKPGRPKAKFSNTSFDTALALTYSTKQKRHKKIIQAK